MDTFKCNVIVNVGKRIRLKVNIGIKKTLYWLFWSYISVESGENGLNGLYCSPEQKSSTDPAKPNSDVGTCTNTNKQTLLCRVSVLLHGLNTDYFWIPVVDGFCTFRECETERSDRLRARPFTGNHFDRRSFHFLARGINASET